MSKDCKADQILNPTTGRCVKKSGKLGKDLEKGLVPKAKPKAAAKVAGKASRKQYAKPKSVKGKALEAVLLKEVIDPRLEDYPKLVKELVGNLRNALDENPGNLNDTIKDYIGDFFFSPSGFDMGSSTIPDIISDWLKQYKVVDLVREAYLADKEGKGKAQSQEKIKSPPKVKAKKAQSQEKIQSPPKLKEKASPPKAKSPGKLPVKEKTPPKPVAPKVKTPPKPQSPPKLPVKEKTPPKLNKAPSLPKIAASKKTSFDPFFTIIVGKDKRFKAIRPQLEEIYNLFAKSIEGNIYPKIKNDPIIKQRGESELADYFDTIDLKEWNKNLNPLLADKINEIKGTFNFEDISKYPSDKQKSFALETWASIMEELLEDEEYEDIEEEEDEDINESEEDE